MKDWTKENIGDVLVYKRQMECTTKLINEKIAIYNVDIRVPNTVGSVTYPISLNSAIGEVGIIKNHQKENEKYLEKAGDWCFLHKVSKDEMRELEKIANASKTFLCEDLSSPNAFHADYY